MYLVSNINPLLKADAPRFTLSHSDDLKACGAALHVNTSEYNEQCRKIAFGAYRDALWAHEALHADGGIRKARTTNPRQTAEAIIGTTQADLRAVVGESLGSDESALGTFIYYVADQDPLRPIVWSGIVYFWNGSRFNPTYLSSLSGLP